MYSHRLRCIDCPSACAGWMCPYLLIQLNKQICFEDDVYRSLRSVVSSNACRFFWQGIIHRRVDLFTFYKLSIGEDAQVPRGRREGEPDVLGHVPDGH